MIEKIYKGKNFKKIIEKIKRELGDDAIVHSTKIIEQKYPLPFLKKKIFEIKASKNIESPQIIIREKIENFENEEKFPFLYDCRDLYDNLVENGIEPVLAKSMVINFSLKINPSTSENKKTECLKELIKNFLKECLPKEKNEFKKISFFLGPTGVGKTLSIVKIAGEFSIKRKKKITIISIDFYKIGGEEQLKKYAEVLKLPCEFAFTPFQLEKLINIHSKESDYIFIDTPGISPNNKQLISQIQSFFKNDDINKILLFSSTTGINEIYHIWESFKFFKIDELGITKLDEAKSKGHILKFLIDVQIPIRFITFGTKVPEDIKFVNNDSLVSNLLGW